MFELPTLVPASPAPVIQPLWTPSAGMNRDANFTHYIDWLRARRGLKFNDYRDTWQWSVTEIEQFWASLWDYFEIDAHAQYWKVLYSRDMPGAHWFAGSRLNYAQHALRHGDDTEVAIIHESELRPRATITRGELRDQVASVAAALRSLGVKPGDRVAAYLPNIPEAVIGFLACASIGAVWSCCSPEFGATSVIARFRQIQPKVLIAVDGYMYGGNAQDRMHVIAELRDALPSLIATILVPYLEPTRMPDDMLDWNALTEHSAPQYFESVRFEHPLWILFSSGTTGVPKAIVHGHGGIVLEHLKSLALQNNMKPGDRFFWQTTTSWMMWNVLVGGLLCGCAIVLHDGSPAHPDLEMLWRLAEETGVTRFGAGASFYTACMKAGLRPADRVSMNALRAIGSTGAPLTPEAFRWIHESVKRDVWVVSSSGGTDVATAFLGACPLEPVYAGELQGPALGVAVKAFDAAGNSMIGPVGELVITKPMPSMPVCFWNDEKGERYRESYFTRWPGVWRHGDWVRFTVRGSAIIEGRSDATLNRNGVRIGTGEIYPAVESVEGVSDSLIVGVEQPNGGYWMPLFIVLRDGVVLDDTLRAAINDRIRMNASPRHVPDEIIAVPAIPRTVNGKKMELPVKSLLLGSPAAVDEGAMQNPVVLQFFADLAASRVNQVTSHAGPTAPRISPAAAGTP